VCFDLLDQVKVCGLQQQRHGPAARVRLLRHSYPRTKYTTQIISHPRIKYTTQITEAHGFIHSTIRMLVIQCPALPPAMAGYVFGAGGNLFQNSRSVTCGMAQLPLDLSCCINLISGQLFFQCCSAYIEAVFTHIRSLAAD
jgi:hypothetical protein